MHEKLRCGLFALLTLAAIAAAGCGAGADTASAAPEKMPTPVPPSAQRPVIEESDIYRKVGTTLYVQNRQTGLNLIDVADPARPTMLGRVAVASGAPGELYVREGQAIVLLKQASLECLEAERGSWETKSEMVIVDTTDPTRPQVRARWCLPGELVASRLVNSVLYTVTHRAGMGSRVYSFDITDPKAVSVVQRLDFPDGSKEIFVSPQAIFVAGRAIEQPDSTSLQMISIYDDGKMTARGSLVIQGQPQGRFHMDLHGSYFRIVTFTSSPAASRLTVVDLSDPDHLRVKGSLDKIGSGEKLYATRFDGDRAYVVTFRQTDPLWIISLADPAHPAVVGELRVPGWSDFLFPKGNRLIAVGRGDRGSYVGVSLFDVTDPRSPQAIQQISLGDPSSTSEATVDHRAAALIESPGSPLLLAIPHTRATYGSSCAFSDELDLVEVQSWGLRRRGKLQQQGTIRRAFLVSSALYSLSDYEIVAADISNRDNPRVLATMIVGDQLEVDTSYRTYCESWEESRMYREQGYYGDADYHDHGFRFCAVGRGPAGAPPLSLILLGLAYTVLRLRRRPR